MRPRRYLIVNADDFGQSFGVNQGVIASHEQGIVTSTSLMVRWPAAEEAAAYARQHPRLGIGLHIDLGEWSCRDGTWVQHYEVVPADDARAVAGEAVRQLDRFRRLVGKDPSHIDSHQHIHREAAVAESLASLARDLDVPLRHYDWRVRYCGDFYGQMDRGLPMPDAITVESLIRILKNLPEGISELACHPAAGSDLDTMYGGERAVELTTLCDPRVHAAVATYGITLCSFADLPTPYLG
jgi:predicted glycoside hydrolase/deacetylase ChbG (UPF0249 family)